MLVRLHLKGTHSLDPIIYFVHKEPEQFITKCLS